MGIDLVCIDVDGTLVGPSGEVLPEVWAGAERARAAGVHLALCSGRPAFGITPELARRLDPRGWHIFQNGSSIVNVGTGESRSRALPAEAVRMLVERARASGRVLELYADLEYAVEVDAPHAREHARLLGVPFRARDLDSLPGPIVRAQWVLLPQEVEATLAEPYGDLNTARSLSPVQPGVTFVAITPPGVDKASGVAEVAAACGTTLARTMMVGDAENDLEALAVVGHPVAMGNSTAAVLAAVSRQVGHVDEAGLVEALEIAIASRGQKH